MTAAPGKHWCDAASQRYRGIIVFPGGRLTQPRPDA
jgi:hypothetical protein